MSPDQIEANEGLHNIDHYVAVNNSNFLGLFLTHSMGIETAILWPQISQSVINQVRAYQVAGRKTHFYLEYSQPSNKKVGPEVELRPRPVALPLEVDNTQTQDPRVLFAQEKIRLIAQAIFSSKSPTAFSISIENFTSAISGRSLSEEVMSGLEGLSRQDLYKYYVRHVSYEAARDYTAARQIIYGCSASAGVITFRGFAHLGLIRALEVLRPEKYYFDQKAIIPCVGFIYNSFRITMNPVFWEQIINQGIDLSQPITERECVELVARVRHYLENDLVKGEFQDRLAIGRRLSEVTPYQL